MRQHLLGSSGLRVSELSLGTMTFGQPDWGADAAEAAAIFEAYADAGGNFIDTADRYGHGETEPIVGDLVRKDRDRFVLATKFALSRGEHPNSAGAHRKSLVHALEGSLSRLGVDYIDLYWVHARDPLTPMAETMRALDELVRAGKVLYVGVSDTPAWLVSRANAVAEANGWSPFVAYQGEYSLIERTAERDVLPMCRALDLSFLAWAVLGMGLLTGKYRSPGHGGRFEVVGITDQRWNDRVQTITAEVEAVAGELGATPSQVAVRWAIDQPSVIPMIGARTIDQTKDNLGALDLELTSEQHDRLAAASAITLGFPHEFLGTQTEFLFGAAVAGVEPPAVPRA